MRVKMLVETFYNGDLSPGDFTEVDEKTADRWIKNGIAEQQEKKTTRLKTITED